VRAYLDVRDPIEIGIQIFEICKGGNLGVFDDACFSLHLQRFTGVVVRMLLRIRAGVLSVAIHFATFDTKKPADWRAAR
jgi:hypothetical protein